MAKIGTAHVEIKPVLAEAALDEIGKRIEDAVAEGVRRGMDAARPAAVGQRFPWTPEVYVLADLFDLFAQRMFKHPTPYPRPVGAARATALEQQRDRIDARPDGGI